MSRESGNLEGGFPDSQRSMPSYFLTGSSGLKAGTVQSISASAVPHRGVLDLYRANCIALYIALYSVVCTVFHRTVNRCIKLRCRLRSLAYAVNGV